MGYRNSSANRLPVSRKVQAAHFFYHTKAPELAAADVQLIVSEVRRLWHERGLTGPHIEAFSPETLRRGSALDLSAVFARFIAAMRNSCTREKTVEFVVCQWAAPHVDNMWAGIAFYSTVLHTGPSDYVMQTLHTGRTAGENLPEVFDTTRTLKVGDAFVFDPTTPHFAAPRIPHEEQLLILMQTELDDKDKEARKKLLKVLPPAAHDRSSPFCRSNLPA